MVTTPIPNHKSTPRTGQLAPVLRGPERVAEILARWTRPANAPSINQSVANGGEGPPSGTWLPSWVWDYVDSLRDLREPCGHEPQSERVRALLPRPLASDCQDARFVHGDVHDMTLDELTWELIRINGTIHLEYECETEVPRWLLVRRARLQAAITHRTADTDASSCAVAGDKPVAAGDTAAPETRPLRDAGTIATEPAASADRA